MGRRSFDVVVLGPTGATGRRVVRHLARRAAELGCSWAVGGRDAAAMAAVLADAEASVPALVVDTTDVASVSSAVARSRVVLNLVGPYASCGGTNVHAACVEHGTHAVDVCGEVDWLADIEPILHDAAQAAGVTLIHSCGFQAAPFDLLTLRAAELAVSAGGRGLSELDVAVSIDHPRSALLGGQLFGPGSWSTATSVLRRGRHRVLDDTRALDRSTDEAQPFDLTPWRHPTSGNWLGPLLPSPHVNPLIVQRTVGLLRGERPELFAPGFRYREGLDVAMALPEVSPQLAARALAASMASGSALLDAPASLRATVARLFELGGPTALADPADADGARWSWRLVAQARSVDGDPFELSVEGSGHPGYDTTARLAAEAALRLAAGQDRTRPGLVTPAAGLGLGWVTALEQVGISFGPSPA